MLSRALQVRKHNLITRIFSTFILTVFRAFHLHPHDDVDVYSIYTSLLSLLILLFFAFLFRDLQLILDSTLSFSL